MGAGVFEPLSSCFAVSVVPFMRRDMGERYFGWINLFFGYTIVANFTFLGSWLLPRIIAADDAVLARLYRRKPLPALADRAQEPGGRGVALDVYGHVAVAAADIGARRSSSSSSPLSSSWPGISCRRFRRRSGWWLTFAAGGLFINNHIVYYNERQAILDMRDAQIESKFPERRAVGKTRSANGGLHGRRVLAQAHGPGREPERSLRQSLP